MWNTREFFCCTGIRPTGLQHQFILLLLLLLLLLCVLE